MNNKINKMLFICIIIVMSLGHVYAQTVYSFDNFDLAKWEVISGTWQINETLIGTGNTAEIVYKKWEGKEYISEIDFAANKTMIPDYAGIGFFFYYKDSNNYGRINIADNNQGNNVDSITIQQKGTFFTNTNTYNIDSSTNASIDLNKIHHLKIVRINKNIYVYYDKYIALTTEFIDENPNGKIGLNVYESTGFFSNFYLRPIEIKNASVYIDRVNITSNDPNIMLGSYILNFKYTKNGIVIFNLNKFGKNVDTIIASEGNRISMKFENGENGISFKLAKVSNMSAGSNVELEDIIFANPEHIVLDITNATILSTYYQNTNMPINFSIVNLGGMRFNGTTVLTVSSEDDTIELSPELNLDVNQSKNFIIDIKTAKTPGIHEIVASLKFGDYAITTKSIDYKVIMLNPTVTMLSSDLQENDGIRGVVTFNSAYPDEFVKWDTNMTVEIFRIVENGRERTYFQNISVTENNNFNIYVPYKDFYQYDGRYLVSLTLGNMKSERLFEIKGSDGIYSPTDKSEIILVTDILYSQLILLLIGMVAALSIRNYKNQKSDITLDSVITGCGSIILIAGIYHGWISVTVYGIFMTGIGLMLFFSRKNDIRVNKLILLNTPIHDFVVLTIIFLSMAYLILLIPEWNTVLTMGTLVIYYIVINIHR